MRGHRAYVSYAHKQLEIHGIDQADHLRQRQIQQRLIVSEHTKQGRGLTDHKIWGKLVCNRHDDLLEGIDIVTITETTCWPSDIDGSSISYSYWKQWRYSRSLSSTTSDHVDSSEIARGVEITPIVSMYGDVQDIRIVPECSLCSIPMVYIPSISLTRQVNVITHQSRIKTFFANPCFWISFAATATLLKKQKPICSSGSA